MYKILITTSMCTSYKYIEASTQLRTDVVEFEARIDADLAIESVNSYKNTERNKTLLISQYAIPLYKAEIED